MGLVGIPFDGLLFIWRTDANLLSREKNCQVSLLFVMVFPILGPLLFIVFINDLPLYVTSSRIDLYANDITLTSSTNDSSIGRLEGTLNSSIAEIVDWAASNKLPIYEGKTKAMLITGKRLPSKINEEMT